MRFLLHPPAQREGRALRPDSGGRVNSVRPLPIAAGFATLATGQLLDDLSIEPEMKHLIGSLLAISASFACARTVLAGMPSPLPNDVVRVVQLNVSAQHRIQAISFFLLGLLLSTLAVRWLWNFLRRDFSKLPHLTFGKALALVCIWGLLFVVVLTMISGARELMTPGAWQQNGLTYTIANEGAADAEELDKLRREASILRLKNLLWELTEKSGHFPSSKSLAGDRQLWKVPGGNGLEYLYFPGNRNNSTRYLVACEPDLFHGTRFVLFSDGQVQTLTNGQIRKQLGKGRAQ